MLMPKKSFRVFHKHAAAHFYIFFTDSMNSTDFHINYISFFLMHLYHWSEKIPNK